MSAAREKADRVAAAILRLLRVETGHGEALGEIEVKGKGTISIFGIRHHPPA